MATTQTPCANTGKTDKKQMTTGSMDFDPELDSVSDVDREPINGGMTESNWKDARKATRASVAKPQLEDGAD